MAKIQYKKNNVVNVSTYLSYEDIKDYIPSGMFQGDLNRKIQTCITNFIITGSKNEPSYQEARRCYTNNSGKSNLDLSFFGDIGTRFRFIEAKGKLEEQVQTCGVNFSNDGVPNFFFNKNFVESLDEKSMGFVIIHEILHILLSHVRSVEYNKLNPEIANYVEDMIINTIIIKDITNNFENIKLFVQLPTEVGLLTIPPEYNDGVRLHTTLYVWLFEEVEKRYNEIIDYAKKNNLPHDTLEELKEIILNGVPSKKYCVSTKEMLDNLIIRSGAGGKSGDCNDSRFGSMTLDSHLEDEEGMTEDIKKGLIERLMDELNNISKSRGLDPGDLFTQLGSLYPKKKDYLKPVKFALNEFVKSIKKSSWTRPNRRFPDIKGYKKVGVTVNVLLDTSGSMGGEFEKVLSYVLQNNLRLNVIQCDAMVQSHNVINSMGELKKMKINGLGGTELQPGVNYLVEKKLTNNGTVILTDGYCDRLNFNGGFKKVLIITTGQTVEYDNPDGCQVIEIKVDVDKK